MEYRTLGRTGVEVSSFCLGAMMFGAMGTRDHDECVRIIHRALDAGINFVDTADVYSRGESEQIVGRALAGRRDEVVLATKVHGAMGDDRLQQGNSRRWIMREVEDSLRRLDTDHIDLYQIHRPEPGTDLEETLGALSDLVHQGKVRYLGCSTFPAHTVVEAHRVSEQRHLERFMCEQPPYSIFVRHAERDLFDVIQRYGMGAIVWSPLAGGWLTGKYRRGQPPPEGSRAQRMAGSEHPAAARYDPDDPRNAVKLDAIERLAEIADEAGTTLTRMANSWTLHHPAVTSAIIGPRTMDHLEDALAGADLRLTDDTLDAIDEVVPPGTTLTEADRGWTPPWMAPAARRRSLV